MFYFLEETVIASYFQGKNAKLVEKIRQEINWCKVAPTTLINLYNFETIHIPKTKIDKFVEAMGKNIVDFDQEAASEFVKIQTELRITNKPRFYRTFDLLLAAVIRCYDSVLWTSSDQVKRFEGIQKLRVLIVEGRGDYSQRIEVKTNNKIGIVYYITKSLADLDINISHIRANSLREASSDPYCSFEVRFELPPNIEMKNVALKILSSKIPIINPIIHKIPENSIDSTNSVCCFQAEYPKNKNLEAEGYDIQYKNIICDHDRVALLAEITEIFWKKGINIMSINNENVDKNKLGLVVKLAWKNPNWRHLDKELEGVIGVEKVVDRFSYV